MDDDREVLTPAQLLAQAQAAADVDEWERAIALVAELEPADRDQRVGLAFLRVRAALHGDVLALALATLDALAATLARPDELVAATMLRGAALVALGRPEDGLALLREAADSAPGEQRFEARLELALGYWRCRRGGDVARVLDAILSATGSAPAVVLARAFELYGRLELSRRRQPIAARHFRAALDVLARSPRPARLLRATLLHDVLAIAVQRLDVQLLEWVCAELARFDWRPAVLHNGKRAVLPLLAQGYLLLGEVDSAWEASYTLRAEATLGLHEIVGALSAAQVARAAGERWTPRQLVVKAGAAAAQVDWAATGPAGLRTLLALIPELAAIDLGAAHKLLHMYESLPRMPSALADDDDRLPLEYLARGAIDGAAGDTQHLAVNLRRAIEHWHDRGDAHAELQICVALAEATRGGRALRRADALARLVPRSELHHRCAAMIEPGGAVVTLTPAERNVMLAIARGLSTAQIAAKFERSPHTIRNQTRKAFTVMGVRSRSQLVLRCAQLDLIGPAWTR